MRIAVVGLGQMGLAMAGRAVAMGATVLGTDLDLARRIQPLQLDAGISARTRQARCPGIPTTARW